MFSTRSVKYVHRFSYLRHSVSNTKNKITDYKEMSKPLPKRNII